MWRKTATHHHSLCNWCRQEPSFYFGNCLILSEVSDHRSGHRRCLSRSITALSWCLQITRRCYRYLRRVLLRNFCGQCHRMVNRLPNIIHCQLGRLLCWSVPVSGCNNRDTFGGSIFPLCQMGWWLDELRYRFSSKCREERANRNEINKSALSELSPTVKYVRSSIDNCYQSAREIDMNQLAIVKCVFLYQTNGNSRFRLVTSTSKEIEQNKKIIINSNSTEEFQSARSEVGDLQWLIADSLGTRWGHPQLVNQVSSQRLAKE